MRAVLAVILMGSLPAGALTIEIRYELEGSQFFNQPGAKAALRAAADFYEDLISDSLGAINPSQYAGAAWIPTYAHPNNGATVTMVAQANLVVPADTIILYAGAMNLGAVAARAGAGSASLGPGGLAWWNQVYNRGEPGAVTISDSGFSSNPTDFAPWGGVIFFNTAVANWNFSTTDASGTTSTDALSVALHELGHILGLGAYRQDCSWVTLLDSNLRFTGPLAAQSFGSMPQTDGAHVLPGATKSGAYGSFGVPHGTLIFPLMSEGLTAANTFHVPTDLDLCMLRDMGWQLSIPVRAPSVAKGASAILSVPTTTGFNYEVYRSATLGSWGPPATVLQGNGRVRTWVDPTAASRAFYRVERVAPIAGPAAGFSAVVRQGEVLKPVMCDCGGIR